MSLAQKAVILFLVAFVIVGGAAVYLLWPDPPPKGGFTAEFVDRKDGYRALKETYGLELPTVRQMEPGLMYQACRRNHVHVISAFATDGRLRAYDLRVLDDDRNAFPPYYGAPVVRGDVLQAHPEVDDVLRRLGGKIDTPTMRRLNLKADRERGPMEPSEVAREFLLAQGLIEADGGGDGSAGTITVGGKNFTEQSILAELMAQMIEHHTDLGVERSLFLGGTMICFEQLRAGDIDIYAEYTGTGLMNVLDRDIITDPDETYRTVAEAYGEKWDLVWLEPFGFNNAYVLAMRDDLAAEYGLETISDLPPWIEKVKAEEIKLGE